MKIPGKQPIKTIVNKLPQLNSEQQKAISDVVNNGVSNNIVSLNTKEILYKKSDKTFSVKFLNYVEPYLIKGQRYTLFYTDIDHNLKIGDRIFIVGGNYDSDVLIQNNKFSKLSDGYTVQYVDKTKIVLDIEYTGVLPWIDEDIDSFIKVYVASNQEEFDYFIQTTSNRDYYYLSNRFASSNPFSDNSFLYINGTVSVSGSDYGILGFTNSGSYSLTYSNSFLVLSGTSSGYLRDITSDVMSGSFSQYLSQPRLTISSGYSVDGDPSSPFSSLYLTFTKKHGLTSTTSGIKINLLIGSGTFSIWNGITTTFAVIDEFTLKTSALNGGNSYESSITGGIVTKTGLGYNEFENNNNLRIINGDFEKSGTKFKNGYSYEFLSNWKVNRKYFQPFISEQNFRNGVFKKGEFNQGL
jgi:hypothetical protein